MSTMVPGWVPACRASRHLFPYTRSSPAAVAVHCWFDPPLQSKIVSGVWLSVALFGTSRHLLVASLISGTAAGSVAVVVTAADGFGVVLVVPVLGCAAGG